MRTEVNISKLLVLAAVVLLILRAFAVGDNSTLDLGWLGLGIFAASFVVP